MENLILARGGAVPLARQQTHHPQRLEKAPAPCQQSSQIPGISLWLCTRICARGSSQEPQPSLWAAGRGRDTHGFPYGNKESKTGMAHAGVPTGAGSLANNIQESQARKEVLSKNQECCECLRARLQHMVHSFNTSGAPQVSETPMIMKAITL